MTHRVTAVSHPSLFEAFETISHDSGGKAGWHSYFVPHAWRPKVAAADAALSTLSPDEMQTFCIGEQTESGAIAARSPELKAAHDLLNAFFDNPDWPHPFDEDGVPRS